MGNRNLDLLLMIFTFFLISAASSPTQNGLLSDIQQQEHGIRDANGEHYTRSGIAHGGKIAHGISSEGAHGGYSTGSGEHGSNSGSGSPYAQGGAAIIPVVAGGAASNRHPNTHHSAGSCNRNCIGLLITFILTAIASLVHLYIGWLN